MKKRLLACLLTLVMLLALLPATALAADGAKTSGNCGPYDYANGVYSDTVTWKLSVDSTDSNKYVLVISGRGPMGNAYTTVNGVPSGAPEWYDLKDSIVKVIIEDGVTSVGAKSFKKYTSLKEASLPAGITEIGADAFYGSGITSVKLPTKLEKMGAQAFYNCSSLVGEIVIPSGVAEIPDSAFKKTNISAVSFGSGVKSIGKSAFSECAELKEVVLPDSVASIGDTAFGSCSKLETVVFPSNTQFTAIPKNSFKNCTALKEIQIPDSVVEIGESAFYSCSAVTKVILPKALTTIAKEAFYGDSSLVAAFIPATATNIPYGKNKDNQIFKGMANNSVIYLENHDLIRYMLQSTTNPDSTENGYTVTTTALAVTDGGAFMPSTTFTAGVLAEPFKAGYKFEGWHEAEDCSDAVFTGTPVAGKTYYAKWAPRSLDRITVEPKQIEYVIGTTLSAADFIVTANYNNGEQEIVLTDGYTIEPNTALTTPGDVKVTATFGEKTAECTIKVISAPVIPVTPSAPAQLPFNPDAGKTKFTDVSGNAWYTSAVNYAVDKGLMNGTGEGKFSPEAATTRGMIVTILARLDGKNTSGTPWYQAGQRWAMEYEISDGTNMTGAITREQMVTMLFRYAVKNGLEAVTLSENLTQFTDASDISAWAVSAMQWAVGQGLIQGSNGQLRPQSNASRAEVATILMRFCELLNK